MLGTRIREMSSREELETSSQDRQMPRMPRTDYHLVTHNLKEELLDGLGSQETYTQCNEQQTGSPSRSLVVAGVQSVSQV